MAERVVSCLSGGVDSSVAASLLVEAGYDVVGVFMRSGVSGQATGEKQGCCSVEDALDARRVADQLGIPFYALNMEEAFGRLIDRFVGDYARGWTPNPCVLCNRWLKVGHVLQFARKLGATKVATGHYARRVEVGDRVTLARPVDDVKDQTYVLAVLEQDQLRQLLLPLGELTKPQVRDLARARGLDRVAGKRDSQEICFVPGDYRVLLRERLPADAPALQPGDVQDLDGNVLGRHEGAATFTVGQRKGIRIPAKHPLYVQRTDPGRRLVVVGPADRLGRRQLEAQDATWLGEALEPGEVRRGRAQVRAHGRAHPGQVECTGERAFRFTFDDDVNAVVPGQAVVVYDEANQHVLLSGWIHAVAEAPAPQVEA
jgi:tRNA-specific 2-thiouridylase